MEIQELKARVAQKYDGALKTTKDFEKFVEHLLKDLGETVSASTMKRMWGYVNDEHRPRRFTLDVLARYVGRENFEDFCRQQRIEMGGTSDFLTNKQLMVQDMLADDVIEIGWAPDRLVRLQVDEEGMMTVTESLNSKLQKGDRMPCVNMIEGEPLYVPYLIRNGERTATFVAGKVGGLSIVKRVTE